MGLRFPDVSVVIDHPQSLHPVVGASDGRGHPAKTKGKTCGRGGAFRRWLASLTAADVIGVIVLFAAPILILMLNEGGVR